MQKRDSRALSNVVAVTSMILVGLAVFGVAGYFITRIIEKGIDTSELHQKCSSIQLEILSCIGQADGRTDLRISVLDGEVFEIKGIVDYSDNSTIINKTIALNNFEVTTLNFDSLDSDALPVKAKINAIASDERGNVIECPQVEEETCIIEEYCILGYCYDDNETQELCQNGSCNEGNENPDLREKVIVLYNENSLDAREIAEYYSNARGLNMNKLCPVKLPTGQFATASQLLGARKSIIENCLCKLVEGVEDCGTSKINEIARKSNITHMVIVKGIPPRLTGTSWLTNNEEPSFDFYLSYLLYKNESIFFSGSGNVKDSAYCSDDASFIKDMPKAISRYIRPINPEVDRIVAYGRVEAITKERTLELINRTLEAELRGFQGNMLFGPGVAWYGEAMKDPDYYLIFRDIANSRKDQCVSYIFEEDEKWPYEECKLGLTSLGEIPGEANSEIPVAMNAGIYIGHEANNNGHSAFDGFENMLNWHKVDFACIELCKDFSTLREQQECRENSKDYFREINTDCVGVASGFLGFQLRSWPVQYYGFWPPGWTTNSGGNGALEKTPPIVLQEINESGSHNNYLHYGSLDSMENPECLSETGEYLECVELIAVDLRKIITLNPTVTIAGSKNYTIRFKHRNPRNNNAEMQVKIYAKFDGSISYSSKLDRRIDLSTPRGEWHGEEASFSLNENGKKLNTLLLDFRSFLGNKIPKRWFDLDSIELIDLETGKNLIGSEFSSFDAANIGYVNPGDYASNAIDRLGAVAWWGSSSHHLTGGYAFSKTHRFLGAFFSGRTLGESLAYTCKNAMSGIIYGDPLYNPASVKMYTNGSFTSLNDNNTGFTFRIGDGSEHTSLRINAFQGKGDENSTNWKIDVCYKDISFCDNNNEWVKVAEGFEAAHGEIVPIDLINLVNNPNKNTSFILRLGVWSPLVPNSHLFSYGYFNFEDVLWDVDTDLDGTADAFDNCLYVPNSDQENKDIDKFGDKCDNCIFVNNSPQNNSDSDSFGDKCDNCPFINNENQTDSDTDLWGDVCDINPEITSHEADITSFFAELGNPLKDDRADFSDLALISKYWQKSGIPAGAQYSEAEFKAADINRDNIINENDLSFISEGYISVYDFDLDGRVFPIDLVRMNSFIESQHITSRSIGSQIYTNYSVFDVNFDGVINETDFSIFSQEYEVHFRIQRDLNNDRIINYLDILELKHFAGFSNSTIPDEERTLLNSFDFVFDRRIDYLDCRANIFGDYRFVPHTDFDNNGSTDLSDIQAFFGYLNIGNNTYLGNPEYDPLYDMNGDCVINRLDVDYIDSLY